MIGEECPCGVLAFQSTLCSGPSSAGSARSLETPSPFGPRKRVQSEPAKAAQLIRQSAKTRIAPSLDEPGANRIVAYPRPLTSDTSLLASGLVCPAYLLPGLSR